MKRAVAEKGSSFAERRALDSPLRTNCDALYYLIAAGNVVSHAASPSLSILGPTATRKLARSSLLSKPSRREKADQAISGWRVGRPGLVASYPQFQNETSKMFKVAGSDLNPVEWRYLYTCNGSTPVLIQS